jgi:hypothetical protein
MEDVTINKNRMTMVNAVVVWAKRGLSMLPAVPSCLKETSLPVQLMFVFFGTYVGVTTVASVSSFEQTMLLA